MRIMCLDVGKVRVGIAQSDPMQIIASPLEVLKRTQSINNDAKYVANLVKTNEVGLVVVGLPLKLDGTEGDSAIMAREFAEKLAKFSNGFLSTNAYRLSIVHFSPQCAQKTSWFLVFNAYFSPQFGQIYKIFSKPCASVFLRYCISGLFSSQANSSLSSASSIRRFNSS